jgi:SAM-dependent methyltransferase
VTGPELSGSSTGAVEARWGESEFVGELADAFWMNPAEVRAYLNRLSTGSPYCDWLTWFKAHWFPPAPGGESRQCLVLGCGDGWLERALVADRPDLRVDASDVAPGAVARAIETARALGIDTIEYSVRNLDRDTLPANRYDLVIAHSVLHHVAELEHAFDQIGASLRPGGLMVVNEFIGPRHLQYTDAALEVVDRLLNALPERYRRSSSTGEVLTSKPRPDLGYLLKVDPSESVRADELDGVLRARFDVHYEADIGGTVLQHLLWQIAHNFRDDEPFDRTIVGLLCALEECLVSEGALESDYRVYVVGRRGKAVPADSTGRGPSSAGPASTHPASLGRSRLVDAFPPRTCRRPASAPGAWRSLPPAREHLHEIATGSPACDWPTLVFDRLAARGLSAADPVLVIGDSWLARLIEERFPASVKVRSRRSLLWLAPGRRFAAIVAPAGIRPRSTGFDAFLWLARRRLRPGGVLVTAERLEPTARNRRVLACLAAGAQPLPASAQAGANRVPFALAPDSPRSGRDLERGLTRLGLAVERLPLGGEVLEPLLDGAGFEELGYSERQIAELGELLVAGERILRRASVLDEEGVVYLARESGTPPVLPPSA